MENNFIGGGTFRFGKYKGKSFIDVALSDEADYFIWLWERSEKGKLYLDSDLHEFIKKNLSRLRQEAKRCKEAYEADRYDELMRDW